MKILERNLSNSQEEHSVAVKKLKNYEKNVN